jgi:hypothetical protein
LKASNSAAKRTTDAARSASSQNTRKKIKVIQQQLASQKTHSQSQIKNTVYHNDLFTPSSKPSVTRLKKQGDLTTVLSFALNNNLDIQSSLQTAHSTLARYDQLSFLDDTLAQYAAFTKDLKLTTGTKKHNKPVSNSFPFPGLLAMKAGVIDQSVEISRLQLKQTVQDTITNVRIAYYELQLATQQTTIISRNIKLLKSLKDQLKDSYSTNTIELGKILQIDIQIEKSRNQRQLAKNRVIAKQARLNALLNLPATFKFDSINKLHPVAITHTADQLIQKGKQKRIEIVRLQSEIKKMQRIIKLSEKRFYPDFSAGYSRFQNQTSLQTGSNASKPAFSTRPAIRKQNFFGTNDAYLTETRAKLQALTTKLRALGNQTQAEIQQLFTNYQSEKKNRSLYRSKVIPKTKTSLEIAKNLFETGDASYLNVIELEKMILDSRLLSLKAVKDMNINAAKLSRLVGITMSGLNTAGINTAGINTVRGNK